jgi:hypothetical protein
MNDRAHLDANEVIAGWHPEDARQVLEAVQMAADGMITKNEMLAKIMDAAGVTEFEATVTIE